MIREVKIDSFDDICSSFSIWIIKYCSQNYTFPLYMVWYSDPNVEGRHAFMLDKSGCIFAVTDLVTVLIFAIFWPGHMINPLFST